MYGISLKLCVGLYVICFAVTATRCCQLHAGIRVSICRLTTCLENLEMSGNLTAVSDMSGILLKIRDVSGKKSCQGKVA